MYNSRNLAMQVLLSLMLSATAYGLVMAGIWSYQQTYAFSKIALSPAVALPFTFCVQFGQNVALYARNLVRPGDRQQRAVWLGVFIALATIDAITNLGQWIIEHGAFNPHDMISVMAGLTGLSFCVGVVFVEEVFTFELAMTLHAWNEVLKLVGLSGIDWLEWVGGKARNFGPWPEEKKRPKKDRDEEQEEVRLGDGQLVKLSKPRKLP